MSEVFGRRAANFGGAFSADDTVMTFPGVPTNSANGVGMLITSSQWQYQQQVSRGYDVVSNDVFYMQGRAAGDGRFESLGGPRRLSAAFMQAYGTVCAAATNDLGFRSQAGCGAGAGTPETFTAKHVVLNSFGQQIDGESMQIRRGLGFTFIALYYL